MSLARKIAQNTMIQVLGKAISTALGVIIIAWMTRLLGTEGFGIYSTATAYLQIFALILDLGINVSFVAMLGEHAGDETYEKRCVSAIFTFRLVTAICILTIAPLIWWLIYPEETGMTLIITALTGSYFFPALNQIVIGVQQRHLKMTASAIGENLGRLFMVASLFIAQSQNWNLAELMIMVSLGSLVNFVFNIWQTRRLGYFHWNWDPAFWKRMLARSWPIGLSIAFNLVYFKADTLILSRLRTNAETGLYGAAYRVLEILITIPFIYAGILLPLLSKAHGEKNHEKFTHLLSRSIDLMMLLICPLIAGTIAIGPQLMESISGPAFAEAGSILQILILAVGVIYINTIFSHAVVALQAQKRMLPVYGFTALITLGGYFLFIPYFGMYAAAWLTVLSELFIGIGNIYITTRSSSLALNWKPSFAAIVSALAMGIITFQFRDAWLPIPLLIGTCSYLIFILLLGGIKMSDLKKII